MEMETRPGGDPHAVRPHGRGTVARRVGVVAGSIMAPKNRESFNFLGKMIKSCTRAKKMSITVLYIRWH